MSRNQSTGQWVCLPWDTAAAGSTVSHSRTANRSRQARSQHGAALPSQHGGAGVSSELGVSGLEQQLLVQSRLAGTGAQQTSFRSVSGASRVMRLCGAWTLVGPTQHVSWQGISFRDEPVKHDSLSSSDVTIAGSSRWALLLSASLARLGISWSGS